MGNVVAGLAKEQQVAKDGNGCQANDDTDDIERLGVLFLCGYIRRRRRGWRRDGLGDRIARLWPVGAHGWNRRRCIEQHVVLGPVVFFVRYGLALHGRLFLPRLGTGGRLLLRFVTSENLFRSLIDNGRLFCHFVAGRVQHRLCIFECIATLGAVSQIAIKLKSTVGTEHVSPPYRLSPLYRP